MDSHNFLRSRRSIRRFKPDPLDSATLLRVLETATYAPSAHNRQPWRFAVIIRSEQKSLLGTSLAEDFRRDLERDGLDEREIQSRITRSQNRINSAPVVIVLCMDVSEMDVYPAGPRAEAERTMAVQSVAAAGLQLQMAANTEGLDSVWTCSPLFAPETVKTVLDLPPSWEPQAMFFIGYAAEAPKEKRLKKLEEIVKFL
jgi:coenzyme F420-0:L-glutamate ligase/coenzyme F420-1:gamma-L-glutamate ligase